MSNHIRTRVYTKAARWYNLTCLALITLGSISLVISTAFDAYEIEVSGIEVFRFVVIGLTGILGIVGIVREKLWAKWFIIVAYGFYIFAAIESIVNSFSLGSAFHLFPNSGTLMTLRVGRLIVIIILLVGVALLLKKPRSIDNLSARK